MVLFELWSGFRYPWFFVGTAAATLVSFLDDIYTLPSKLRLPVQLAGVSLLFVDLGVFGLPLWFLWILPAIILGTGIVNVFNFMDGINGITGLYGLVALVTLGYLNQTLTFADERLIILCILSIAVFGFFNFRRRAVCFAGDVGSVSLAFVVVFLLFKLILETGNYYFILLLALYGVDASLTIFQRLKKSRKYLRAAPLSPVPTTGQARSLFALTGRLFLCSRAAWHQRRYRLDGEQLGRGQVGVGAGYLELT